MPNSISIAFACDDGYAKHVAVVMKSIFANAAAEDRHEFHILTMKLTPESESRLLEVATSGGATMYVHRVDAERLSGFPVSSHPLETYLRLLLPEILPESEKILYLDADLMVFASLAKLWNFPIGDNAIAAAIDSMTLLRGETLAHFNALQLPEEHLYFNAGVLLLNLRVLREIHLLERVKEWASSHLELMQHSDQDALNVVLAGKLAYFHLRWNLQVPLIAPIKLSWVCKDEHANAVAEPAIIHYVTYRKPWRREFRLPHQSLYFQYLKQTPWREDSFPVLTFQPIWNRCVEELEWAYQLVMSKIRLILGRRFVLWAETSTDGNS